MRAWGAVWQLPALVGAGALLVAGVAVLVLGGPKPDLESMIGKAEAKVARQEYRMALDELNTTLRSWYDSGSMSPEQMRRFHLLRARAVYLGEREIGLQLPENARSIVEEYTAAAREEPLADPRDIYFLAEAYITLSRYERALELARALAASTRPEGGDDEVDWSRMGPPRLYRRIVERQLSDPDADGELALRLLDEFLREGQPSTSDRAWALARQAQILIRQRSYDAAIARVLRTMPALLPDLEPEEIGELYLMLGQAYIETGAMAQAGRQLQAGLAFLLDTDERWAKAMILLARVDEAMGEPAEDALTDARQKYLAVVARFEGSNERLAALLGLAEVEAALGDSEASLAAYAQLVNAILDGRSHPQTTPEVVTGSLLARWRGNFDAGESEAALSYAQQAERLSRLPSDVGTSESDRLAAVPPAVLLAIARSHLALAEKPLPMPSEGASPAQSRAQQIAELDAATRQGVRAHLMSAGRYFKRHADLIGIADNVAFGDSLWQAALAYDLAGDLEASIPLFADYVTYFPGDPRRAEARYRLARAYQARGDYPVAAEQFRALLADARATSGMGRAASAEAGAAGVGPFADLSVVPLAQALLQDGDPATDEEAKSLLNDAVAGRAGGINTPQFRDGLVELGLLLQRQGDYAGAIQRLEEAVMRFPSHPRVESVRFQLAEAHRQDALAIRRTLSEAMPDHRRQMLKEARIERLRQAEALYEQVRRATELREPRRRSRLEEVQLRNSYFYLGDCAFELGEYETAIQRYDAARERFPTDPAALVAMVQIVNAYIEQGDLQRAATANERARRFYQALPQSAWNDPDLPMSQEDWQRWLDAMTALRPIRDQDTQTAGAEDGER